MGGRGWGHLSSGYEIMLSLKYVKPKLMVNTRLVKCVFCGIYLKNNNKTELLAGGRRGRAQSHPYSAACVWENYDGNLIKTHHDVILL